MTAALATHGSTPGSNSASCRQPQPLPQPLMMRLERKHLPLLAVPLRLALMIRQAAKQL